MAKLTEKEILHNLALISQVEPTSQAADRAVQRARDALEEKESAQLRPAGEILRAIWQSKITRLAAAAVIVIAALLGAHRLIGPIDGATVALGQVVQNMKAMPWMRIISEQEEQWVAFESKIWVWKKADGSIVFSDYGKRESYKYAPTSQTITVTYLHEEKPPVEFSSAFSVVDSLLEETVQEGGKIAREAGEYEGNAVEIYNMSVGGNGVAVGLQLYVDRESHLAIAGVIVFYQQNLFAAANIEFEYPEDGPKDIYALGVPVTAKLLYEGADSDVMLAAEQQKIEVLFAADHADGLVTVLSEAQFEESKVLAANYLAKIGDLQAIEPLEQLSKKWKGDQKDNPFTAAIKEIQDRLEPEKSEKTLTKEPVGEPNVVPVEGTSTKVEQTITYRGIVKDEAGVPIADVNVTSDVFTREIEFKREGATAKTDSNGFFEIGPLTVYAEGQAERALIFEHPDFAFGSCRVDQKRYLDPNYLEITLFAPTIVAGIVTDEQGNSIEGAIVEADMQYKHEKNYYYYFLRQFNNRAVATDADGWFVLEKIPHNAKLHLDVSHKQYGRYSTRVEYKDAGEFPISASEQDLRITLKQGGFIKGQFVLDGKPYERERIVVLLQGPTHTGSTLATTDETGRFETTGLYPGTYILKAQCEAFAKEGLTSQTLTDVEVVPGEDPTEVQFVLTRGLPVRVRVVDEETAEPLDKVGVRANVRGNKYAMVSYGSTDGKGQCVLQLTPGEYTFIAQGWKDGRLRDVSKDFILEAGAQDPNVEIAITPRPFVYGWLVDANDNPVRGTVTLGHKPVETDEQGGFEVPEPWGGPMEVHIGYAFDKDRKLGKGFLWKKTDGPNDLEIVLEPLAAITGRMVDQDGNSVADAKPQIWVALPTGGWRSAARNPWKQTIDAAGEFRFEGVPVGLPMDVHAEKPGFQAGIPVEGLEPGKTVDIGDVVLKPLHGFEDGEVDWTGTLSGRVINENNEPMPGLRVSSSIGTQHFEAVTDLKGRYTLTGLPKGKEIRVGVYVAGYGHNSAATVVDGNDFELQMFPQGWDLLNKEAPGLFVEKWLNAEPVTLEQYRGKVVLLQIGILLPNYSRHLEPVQEALAKYGDKGLKVIAVHQSLQIDWAGKVTEDNLLAFINKQNIKFPFAIDGSRDKARDLLPPERLSGNGAMYSLYGVKATPALYLIDKQGIVRISPTRDDLDQWVKRLLAE